MIAAIIGAAALSVIGNTLFVNPVVGFCFTIASCVVWGGAAGRFDRPTK